MKMIFAVITPLLCAFSSLERATPESQGIPSRAVLALIEKLEEQNGLVHSYMLIRHGKVVAQGHWAPFSPAMPHSLYSISKAFVSMAIGLAVQDGLMSVDDRVVKFFPESVGENPDRRLSEMRVRDLLAMASGQKSDTSGSMANAKKGEAAKAFFEMPMSVRPGQLFRYMSGNTTMLALIHAKVTGEKDLIAYLKPRIFDKLGIEASYWPRLQDGTTVIGGSGFELRTEDLAKICLLLKNEGVWKGERLLPLWWVKQATSLQSKYGKVTDSVLALHGGGAAGLAKPDDWQLGYGWQIWMGHHDSFRLCGAFGQIGAVIPDKDIIFVSNAGGRGSNKPSLNAFYDTVLPALSEKPLEENETALKRLRERSANLVIAPPKGGASGSRTAIEKFACIKINAANRLGIVSAGYDDKSRTLTIENGFGRQTIAVGDGKWLDGELTVEKDNTDTLRRFTGGKQPVAAAGAWMSSGLFKIRIHFVRSPAVLDVKFELRGNEASVLMESNMSKSLSVSSASAAARCAAEESGYTALFDGRTLEGWSVKGGENRFTVEDGCIVGRGVPRDIGINTFLVTDKKYGDFDLKADFKIENGNSGIQFRSTDKLSRFAPRRLVYGYQAEITPDGSSTGRIYDEERRGYVNGKIWLDTDLTPKSRLDAAKASFKKGDWNEMRVVCRGAKIRTYLNGNLVVDMEDDLDKSGFIGLQVHFQKRPKEGKAFVPGVVRFRNIRIKEL